MCAWLGVSRSGFYRWRKATPSARARHDATLSALIRSIHAHARGNPGVRRVWAELVAMGHRISMKRVWRLMQAAGLQGRHPKAWKRTTVPGERPVPAPDLIGRAFSAAAPDQKWCGDITYVKTWTGWAYVATVIDLYSRRIVGYAVADHMRTWSPRLSTWRFVNDGPRRASYFIPIAERRADSTGRRNTLITEVCGGDERLEQEDERCA